MNGDGEAQTTNTTITTTKTAPMKTTIMKTTTMKTTLMKTTRGLGGCLRRLAWRWSSEDNDNKDDDNEDIDNDYNNHDNEDKYNEDNVRGGLPEATCMAMEKPMKSDFCHLRPRKQQQRIQRI